MSKKILLDSGPPGRIAHPKANPEIVDWIQRTLTSGSTLILPEIADFEVRRNLILEGLNRSIARLNDLKQLLIYAPLTTSVMLRAAELWAQARKRGIPTTGLKELDADVILAAQAEEQGAIIATENVGHLSLFVEAYDWRQIS